MTEEDQMLVAHAALHGAQFVRVAGHGYSNLWSYANDERLIAKWTVGRAAEHYLWRQGLRSDDEHFEYDKRTNIGTVEEVDPAFLASVLS